GYNLDHYADILVPINSAFFGADYDRDKKVCVLRFLEHKGREIVLKEYDNRQNLLNKPLSFDPPGLGSMDQGSWILKPFLRDLDDDGKEELIVVIQSGDHDHLGGVFCYDPGSGKLLWHYKCAAAIMDIAFVNLDGDGDRRQEIILSSYAANKGLRLKDIKDGFSYVIVLDDKGKLRWKQVAGSWHTYARTSISDIDNDGIPEVITARESGRQRSDVEGKLFCFDGKTGNEKISKVFPGVSLTTPALLKYNSTVTRIYVGDFNGVVRVLDTHLNLIKEIKKNDRGPLYILNTDTGGAAWRYVWAITPERLMAFDRELEKTVYTYRFSKPIAGNRDISLPLFIPLA
ncbi:MAG: PQQ-like beta-propeller repeat protein, partial [bacterium]|nr:PQQ-like beta-propeller repeat protein [bacterium]